MRTPWRLAVRHLTTHWVRSGLTVTAMIFATFLLCFVISVVTSLAQAVDTAAANRLVVQSAVSLYVDLPLDYQAKIASIPGVAGSTKFQWFGGIYQDDSNFFAQFGVDEDVFFDLYGADMHLTAGPDGELFVPGGATGDAGSSRQGASEAVVQAAIEKAMAADRRACVIGSGLARDFGWEIGDTVPIIGRIFARSDGTPWEFTVVGIYEPAKSNVDDRTLFFRYDYLQEWLVEEGQTDAFGSGVYMVNVEPGADPAAVIAGIDGLFENGPQRTRTTTEAAFQSLFVSMLGNVPFFMGTIGGAIVIAAMFGVINTMLISAQQRRAEQGILKALGFSDGIVARLLVGEAVVLSLLGGAFGLLLAKGGEEPFRKVMGAQLPGYAVEWSTVALGAGVALLVGLIAGLGPAVGAMRISPVDALRSEG